MLPHPLPCAADNLLQPGELGPPIQFTLNFLRAGHQHVRIARPPRRFVGRNSMSGNPPGYFNHFAHAETPTIAEVVDQLLRPAKPLAAAPAPAGARWQGPKRGCSRARRCHPRGVISAEDVDMAADAKRHLQDQGDQVGLRAMPLAKFRGCSRRIKVAQTGIGQPVNAMKPIQHALDQKLRFPVGVGRLQRVALADR